MRLKATAAYLHVEAEYGVGRVERLEVWHLRDERRLVWACDELESSRDEPLALLDGVDDELQSTSPT
jgi:hypothetical protein